MLKWTSYLLTLTSVVIFITACGNTSDPTITSSTESFLLRGNSGEPGTLDPHLARTAPEFIIIGDLFMGLVTMDEKGNLEPGLAKSYSASEGGLSWTFNLKADHTWSDGKEITSADFLYSFRRVMKPETASPMASILFPIKNARAIISGDLPANELGVSAPDAFTLVFTLEKPTPYFDKLLISSVAMPVPKHVIEQNEKNWSRPPQAVSNGAFTLTDWTPRVHVEVTKNPKFFEADEVKLEGVRYLPTEDLSTQLKRFRAGELDLGLNFPPSQAEWVRSKLKDAVRIFPIYGTYYYPINLENEKFEDIRVRQALNMAVDRNIIVERILGSGETPAYSFVPPGFENYPSLSAPDYTSLSMEERLAKAKSLLAESGYDEANPLSFSVRYNMTEEHQAIAVAVSGMWNAIGIKTELLSTEARTHYRDLSIGEYEVGRHAMFANYPDPHAFLYALSGDNKVENYGNYANAKFDQMLEASNRIIDPLARAKAMADAEKEAMKHYPNIPLYYYVSKRLVSPRVRGWQDNPVGSHPSRYLWLENAE